MMDLNEYQDSMIDKYNIRDDKAREDFTEMLVANGWFGEDPVLNEENHVVVSDSFIERNGKAIDDFFRYHFLSDKKRRRIIEERLRRELPQTYESYKKFSKKFGIPDDISIFLADTLLDSLAGELQESTDKEIEAIVFEMTNTAPVSCARTFADFINWVITHYKTVYTNTYSIKNYTTDEENNGAYSMTEYLRILFTLFNEDSIRENQMYEQAAQSKKYTDAWLFISLHFVCALRKSDLVRLPHPRLEQPPESVLEAISNGSFSDEEAKMVLNSVLVHMSYIDLVPNKTKNSGNVPNVKLHIPISVESHFGRLLALAEAHHRASGMRADEPLIHPVSDYTMIRRAMGDDIAELFLETNFRSRKANKSFLQVIDLLTDDILGRQGDDFNVKGYILAALARSHKGSYGEFAQTTSIYLKDNKLSGYTPEFVARELFERGVLSFTSDKLLEIVGGKAYSSLDVKGKTKAIRKLGMSPELIESSVAVAQKSYNQAAAIASDIYRSVSREDILSALNCIGNGDAFSKQGEIQCILSAFKKACPYDDRLNCAGCKYEVSTKATIFMMAGEYNRLRDLYASETRPAVKKKYKALVRNTVVPKMFELIDCMKKQYGEDEANMLMDILSKEYGRASEKGGQDDERKS